MIDYDLWFVNRGRYAFRGPRPDLCDADAIYFIGAAQTFGRFVHDPFPDQVGRALQRTSVNLGISGAGPKQYLDDDVLKGMIRAARYVVVQCMSARSVTAGLFSTTSNFGMLEFAAGPRQGERMLAADAYRVLRREYGVDAYYAQVAAVQKEWVQLYRKLADELQGRKVLLWMSSAQPGHNVDLTKSAVGTFPHFVTDEMLEEVAPKFDARVECTVEAMKPQILINEVTGFVEEVFDRNRFPRRPDWTRHLNTYYATPALHDLAASKLVRSGVIV